MKSYEKRHNNTYSARKDRKIKTSSKAPQDHSTAENHSPVEADDDITARISFLVDYSLVAGKLKCKITHRRTGAHEEFFEHEEKKIMSFMAKYLKGVEESPRPIDEFAESHQPGEVRLIKSSSAQKPGLEIIPEGSAQQSEFLQQGRSFHIRWTFKPPEPTGVSGEQLYYRIVVRGRNIESGNFIKIGESSGQTGFSGVLTALFSSKSLPSGIYFVEADAGFRLKSVKSHQHSACSARRFIKVA